MNVNIGKKNTTLELNWETLEIYWANQYEEEYSTTVQSQKIIWG
jgi:hypothetical protein